MNDTFKQAKREYNAYYAEKKGGRLPLRGSRPSPHGHAHMKSASRTPSLGSNTPRRLSWSFDTPAALAVDDEKVADVTGITSEGNTIYGSLESLYPETVERLDIE